jgi:hypothetical protein
MMQQRGYQPHFFLFAFVFRQPFAKRSDTDKQEKKNRGCHHAHLPRIEQEEEEEKRV